MKTLALTLAATAAMGLALIAPAGAEAGEVHVSITFGLPTVVYYPGSVYRPAVVYQPRAIDRPAPHFRHRYNYGHERHRDYDGHRGHTLVYYRLGYAPARAEVRIDPRLQGR